MKKPLLLISFLIFLFFISLSYVVHKDLLVNFDFDTTVRLQNNINIRFDTFLSTLSLAGSFEILSLVLIVLITIKRKLKAFFILPLIFVLLHLIEIFGKLFVTQVGPPFMFLKTELPFSFPSFYVQPGFSFPSGHSARTVFLSTLIIFFILKNKKISNPLKLAILVFTLILDLGMLISRVYLGEHWTTDVIGGSLLGLSLAIFSLAFF